MYALIRPLLFSLPPETAHSLVLHGLSIAAKPPGALSMLRALAPPADPALQVPLWGRTFANPVGIAAGLDKDGVALAPLLALGCGFVEAGTVTPQAQPGNPRPRLFRLPEDRALINRMGFNNAGAGALARRLGALRAVWPHARIGVNVGKQRETPLADAPADYVSALEPLYALADYVVINVSSPNTPGLRGLQGRDALEAVLAAVGAARTRHMAGGAPRVPVLVKVAPELDEAALADVVAVALAAGCDGLIATNTTLTRDGLRGAMREEAGGLSGRPLRASALHCVQRLHALSEGRLTLVGVGGISSAEDAYALIRAGASLVEVYTGLIFEGPALVRRICRGLVRLLARDGFSRVTDAVGTAPKV